MSDYIRRDTGEPLSLPEYSLSPEQSSKLAEEAKRQVANISEEFRRFRVRAEVAKKQADATVRALHSNSVQTTRLRIEGQDIESELAQAKNDHAKLAALRNEIADQEARWKESYDTLLAENEKLKSSGAEALLAAQWRHRYEACLKEKEDAITNLEMEREKVVELQEGRRKVDVGKYESKYRDLKVRRSPYFSHFVMLYLAFTNLTCCIHFFTYELRNHSDCIERKRKKYSSPNSKEKRASCLPCTTLELKMLKYHISKT